MTLEPLSNSETVVPTALFCRSLPVSMLVMAANFCPACTTKPINWYNVADGSLNGKI